MIQEIKNYALSRLEGKWGMAIGLVLLSAVIGLVLGFIPVLGSLAGLVIGGPFALGTASFFLKLVRGQDARIDDLFSGFKNFGNAFLVSLLMGIFIALGFIFFIIPGIIVALGFSQTYKIMHDNPGIGGWDAMMKSWELMKGKKGSFFVFGLSFIGWGILAALPMGFSLNTIIPLVIDGAKSGQMTTASEILGLGMKIALPVLVSMLAFMVLSVYTGAANARFYDAEVKGDTDDVLGDFASEVKN
jgi:uncharacterized membrane protein